MQLCQAPDYATLSLRCEPASVCVEERDNATQLTVDSANFPGDPSTLDCAWSDSEHPSNFFPWLGHEFLTLCARSPAGILVEVVQHLTELNLQFKSARVSSDGTFFLDGEAYPRHISQPVLPLHLRVLFEPDSVHQPHTSKRPASGAVFAQCGSCM